MKKNEIIYSLNITDIQNVAEEEIDRELSGNEIMKIRDSIADNISWYEAIADAIHKHIKIEKPQ